MPLSQINNLEVALDLNKDPVPNWEKQLAVLDEGNFLTLEDYLELADSLFEMQTETSIILAKYENSHVFHTEVLFFLPQLSRGMNEVLTCLLRMLRYQHRDALTDIEKESLHAYLKELSLRAAEVRHIMVSEFLTDQELEKAGSQ